MPSAEKPMISKVIKLLALFPILYHTIFSDEINRLAPKK
jgi:hypothetical protein